jgi:hypothetical protein
VLPPSRQLGRGRRQRLARVKSSHAGVQYQRPSVSRALTKFVPQRSFGHVGRAARASDWPASDSDQTAKLVYHDSRTRSQCRRTGFSKTDYYKKTRTHCVVSYDLDSRPRRMR